MTYSLFIFAFLMRRHFTSRSSVSYHQSRPIHSPTRMFSLPSDNGNHNNTNSVPNQVFPDWEWDLSLENDWNQEIMNEELILEVDSLEIINQVPRRPQKEEEIQDDSFEGFLRGQFEKILATESPNNREFRVIEFESFLEWRIRMGVFLSHKEILDIFQSVVGQTEYCSLMEFIQINYLIDENRTN